MTTRAQEVIDALQGTCGSLSDHATDDECNDPAFCTEVDDQLFCCDACGWWCEIGEQSTDESAQICEDCFEGEE